MQETIDFARAELTRYMRRITGGSGHIRLELMPQADTASPFDDAFSIEIRKGNGVIAGCCPRSVLLGVYRFLFLLGCRFFAPGADGEVLPSLSLEACTVSYRGRPALRHRGVCIEGAVSVENVLDMVERIQRLLHPISGGAHLFRTLVHTRGQRDAASGALHPGGQSAARGPH